MLVRLLPGDPVMKIIPFGTNLEPSAPSCARRSVLTSRPLQQYGAWLRGLATRRLRQGVPVADAGVRNAGSAAPVTLLLILYAQMLALLVAIPLGVLTAYRAGYLARQDPQHLGVRAPVDPSFVLGLYLAYFVGAKLQWLPAGQYVAFGTDPVEHFRSMALPTISLAAGEIALYMRLLRSDMIATLQESYIKTARSKGISARGASCGATRSGRRASRC